MRPTICLGVVGLLSVTCVGATPTKRPATQPATRPAATRPATQPVTRAPATRPATQPLPPERELVRLNYELKKVSKDIQTRYDWARRRRNGPTSGIELTRSEEADLNKLQLREQALKARIAEVEAAREPKRRRDEELVGMTLDEAVKAFSNDGETHLVAADQLRRVYKFGGRDRDKYVPGGSYSTYVVTVEDGKVVAFEKQWKQYPPLNPPIPDPNFPPPQAGPRPCPARCGCAASRDRACSCGTTCGARSW